MGQLVPRSVGRRDPGVSLLDDTARQRIAAWRDQVHARLVDHLGFRLLVTDQMLDAAAEHDNPDAAFRAALAVHNQRTCTVTYTAACPACGSDATWTGVGGINQQTTITVHCPHCHPSRNVEVPMSDWRHRALCRDADPSIFFPIGTTGPAAEQIEEAKAICSHCLVTSNCLTWALDTGQDSGVWGGMDEDERRALRRQQRKTGVRT
jgi:WhiB family redox-sensing transcriptional regulator